ncbi:MAG: histidine phosphatase family protein [Candidatus Kerfeldbacteria bacterium]|nr:histidine phosphatase family protein [Candidatus Kerfeldbacteria bacterium]
MPWTRPREIVIIRHGQSLRNLVVGENFVIPDEAARERIAEFYDHTIPLTDEGHRQSESTGPPLIQEFGMPDCVYHSGYVRAEQTVIGLLRHLPVSERERIRVYHKIELRERDPGYTWHMTYQEVEQHFPWLFEHHRRVGKFFYRPPGGQSLAELADGRVHSILGTVARDRPGSSVWFVCHGGVIRALRFNLERTPLADVDDLFSEPIESCAVTRYVYEEGSEVPVRTHLNKVYWGE